MRRFIPGVVVGLVTFLTAAAAHAGANGVQVHSLSSDATVVVYQNANKKSFDLKLLQRPFVEATLQCKESGFRVKRLGNQPYPSKTTQETNKWYLTEADLERYEKELVSACQNGRQEVDLPAFLPAHACERVKGIASAVTVHQSRPLKVHLECAMVDKRWYHLPENCQPLSGPRPTKTGQMIDIGCLKKPVFESQPGIEYRYVESYFLDAAGHTRRVALPYGCEVSGRATYEFTPLPSGMKKTSAVRVPLSCTGTRNPDPELRTFDGMALHFIRAVDFKGFDFGIPPVVSLPDQCSMFGTPFPVSNGFWIRVKGNTSKPMPPQFFTDKDKQLEVRFTGNDDHVKYCGKSYPLGPFVKIPDGCFQYACANGSAMPGGSTQHTVDLVCKPEIKPPPKETVGKAAMSYRVVNVPEGCWPTQAHAISVGMLCKPGTTCKRIDVGNTTVTCDNED